MTTIHSETRKFLVKYCYIIIIIIIVPITLCTVFIEGNDILILTDVDQDPINDIMQLLCCYTKGDNGAPHHYFFDLLPQVG